MAMMAAGAGRGAEVGPAGSRERALVGCLLGTAVGDALGLPYEGLGARRAARLLGPADRHRFLFGHGLVSDDTEHSVLVAEALIASRGEPEEFERRLARALRRWLLCLPAGVGWATLRAIVKLWLGFRPQHGGVMSAGNGAAMRSAVLGVALGDSPEKMRELVRRCTRLTHADPRAYHGALAVAVAAHLSATGRELSGADFVAELERQLAAEAAGEMLALARSAGRSAEAGEPVAEFARTIGARRGISGYVFHTVPCVIQVWLRHRQDFEAGVREIIGAGGDADTTAAILGGIVGAAVGREGIPADWLAGLAEWPRSTRWMEQLAVALARSVAGEADAAVPPCRRIALPLRNALFLAVVLAHGLRRLAPPY